MSVDLAYGVVPTRVGELLVAATPAGVVRVAFDREGFDRVLAALTTRISPRVLRAPQQVEVASRQLSEYLEGERSVFDLDLDWQLSVGFRRRVLEATAAIPCGSTSTYRLVAAAAGRPAAARAAGTALATNPLPLIVPCHRVVRTGGDLGSYGGGSDLKRWLLELESRSRRSAA